MEDDVDIAQRPRDDGAFAQIALHKLRFRIHPGRLAKLVRVRLEVIEDAHLPALAHQQIDDVRSDQSRAAGDERAFAIVAVRSHLPTT